MGPRSIVKTEKVYESIFEGESQGVLCEIVSLNPPKKTSDLEKWMEKLLHACGYKDWEEAANALKLPAKTMLLFPALQDSESLKDKKSMLRAAMILSKSNTNRYWPHSPMICTQNRLNRSVRLIELNTREYYGMDEE